jgi:hypothetical protein
MNAKNALTFLVGAIDQQTATDLMNNMKCVFRVGTRWCAWRDGVFLGYDCTPVSGEPTAVRVVEELDASAFDVSPKVFAEAAKNYHAAKGVKVKEPTLSVHGQDPRPVPPGEVQNQLRVNEDGNPNSKANVHVGKVGKVDDAPIGHPDQRPEPKAVENHIAIKTDSGPLATPEVVTKPVENVTVPGTGKSEPKAATGVGIQK